MPPASPQVDQSHYKGIEYDTVERWASYHYQITSILGFAPSSVLEIGIGSGVLRHYLKEVVGLKYSSLDLDPALQPTYCGNLLSLDELVSPAAFDCVCAFQVLEHLPFDRFERAVGQLAKAARGQVILSLPNNGFPVEVRARFLRQRWAAGISTRIRRFKRFEFDGQHYWEIGVLGHPRSKITRILDRHFRRVRSSICPTNSYHAFFACEK